MGEFAFTLIHDVSHTFEDSFYWTGVTTDFPMMFCRGFGIHTQKDVASHLAMKGCIKRSCLQNSCEYDIWDLQTLVRSWGQKVEAVWEPNQKGWISEIPRVATFPSKHVYYFSLQLKFKPSSSPLSPP